MEAETGTKRPRRSAPGSSPASSRGPRPAKAPSAAGADSKVPSGRKSGSRKGKGNPRRSGRPSNKSHAPGQVDWGDYEGFDEELGGGTDESGSGSDDEDDFLEDECEDEGADNDGSDDDDLTECAPLHALLLSHWAPLLWPSVRAPRACSLAVPSACALDAL